ncbi:MAG: helix-turn-helix domain-containing protein [Oscillospiraceae bacterium]|jgi:transcriptional regulator with XRE-family HTH domain|nr:helix-turn-helix domain-containing protein [Oscillospiraceae bacterium]
MMVRYFIYDHRVRKKLSLRELEKLSGVSKSQTNAIENGKNHPSVYTLCLLAKTSKVDASLLFCVE